MGGRSCVIGTLYSAGCSRLTVQPGLVSWAWYHPGILGLVPAWYLGPGITQVSWAIQANIFWYRLKGHGIGQWAYIYTPLS